MASGSTDKKKQPVPQSFDAAMKELERIVDEVESGSLGLEQSLAKYERGQFLLKHCRTLLDAAEKQIELLTQSPEGSLQSTPMDDGPENG